MFHDTFHFFPSAGWGDWWVGCPDQGMGENQPGNWAYQLLNFIEETNKAGLGRGYKCDKSPASLDLIGKMVATAVPVFYCPSRRSAQPYPHGPREIRNYTPPPVAGKSDYAGNIGDLNYVGKDVGPESLEAAATYRWVYSGPLLLTFAKALKETCPTGHTGVIFQRSTVSMNQVTDGTSHTYFVGEKNIQVEHYEDGGAPNDDQSMYNGWDKDNVRSTAITFIPNTTKYVGWPPAPDTPGATIDWAFGGPHPGVWLSVFCDGSVHVLSYEMEVAVHRDLGNRQDGRVLDASGI
jgi:hypothetical protein